MKQLILAAGIMAFCACNKAEFLDKKPQTSLLVPTKLEDFEKLLDNYSVINVSGKLGEISSDNIYIENEQTWAALYTPDERNAYIWATDLFEGMGNINDWVFPYRQILYANIVLEGLAKITPVAATQADYDRIKGWALFIRGHALFNLAQHFAPAYDKQNASGLLGLPIRLEADVTIPSKRVNLEETYRQILSDVLAATEYLPYKAPGIDRNRPYKNAAQGLLSRIYLSMGLYRESLEFAEYALDTYDKLINFPGLDTTSNVPISEENDEVIFSCLPSSAQSLLFAISRGTPNALADTLLFSSYHENDLRKKILYRTLPTNGKPVFKASYTGTTRAFTGIANDELYLNKAESLVRLGTYEEGIETLNKLMMTRWKPGTFQPYEVTTEKQMITDILTERRKELPFRGLRWMDLRRLNLDGSNLQIRRVLGEKEYVLQPNSPLYVLPIPPDELLLSKIEQNNRSSTN